MCADCRKTYNRIRQREWKQNNREKYIVRSRAAWKKRKQAVIDAYGGVCVCCDTSEFEFLTIDHINGGGRKHLDSLGGHDIYAFLKRSGYPKDEYQLLCMNCNFSLGKYGYCPHRPDMEKREVLYVRK